MATQGLKGALARLRSFPSSTLIPARASSFKTLGDMPKRVEKKESWEKRAESGVSRFTHCDTHFHHIVATEQMSMLDMRYSHGPPSGGHQPIPPTGDDGSIYDSIAGPSSFGFPQQSQLDSGEHAFPVLPSPSGLPETHSISSSGPSDPSEEPTELDVGSPAAQEDNDHDALYYGNNTAELNAHAPDVLSNTQIPLAMFPPQPPYERDFEPPLLPLTHLDHTLAPPRPAFPLAAFASPPPILHWNFGFHERGHLVSRQAVATPTLHWPSARCLCGGDLQLQVSSRAPYTPAWHRSAPYGADSRFSLPTMMLWMFRERSRSLLVCRWEPSNGFSSTTQCPFCFRFIHVQWDSWEFML